MEQNLTEYQPQIKLRQSLMGRTLSDLMRKLLLNYNNKVSDRRHSLEHLYMSFYSNLFQELESSYLKLHAQEIQQNKVSLDEAFLQLIEFFKETLQFIWTQVSKSKQNDQFTNPNHSTQNHLICHKCQQLIISKEIQLQKLRIHESLFFDPFNFYSLDLLEHQQQKPSLNKQVQVIDNQKQINAYILSLNEKAARRFYEITELVDQLTKYTNKDNILFHLRNFRHRNQKQPLTFQSCLQSVIDTIEQKVLEIIHKIRIKKRDQLIQKRHLGIQVGYSNFEIQSIISKNLLLAAANAQAQQQLINFQTQIRIFQENIQKISVQLEQNKERNTQKEKQLQKLKSNLLSQQSANLCINSKLKQKEKQIQNLTTSINILKMQIRQQNQKDISVRYQTKKNDDKHQKSPNNIGKTDKQNSINLNSNNDTLDPNKAMHIVEQNDKSSQQCSSQTTPKDDGQEYSKKLQQINEIFKKRKLRRPTNFLLKGRASLNIVTGPSFFSSLVDKNKTMKSENQKDQIKTLSQVDKWQISLSQRQLNQIEQHSKQLQKLDKVAEHKKQQKQRTISDVPIPASALPQKRQKKYRKKLKTQPKAAQSLKNKNQSLIKSSTVKKHFKSQKRSVPFSLPQFQKSTEMKHAQTSTTPQFDKQDQMQELLHRDSMLKSMDNCKQNNNKYIKTNQIKKDNNLAINPNICNNQQQTSIKTKIIESLIPLKFHKKKTSILPIAANLKPDSETKNKQTTTLPFVSIFEVEDVENLYLSIQGSLQHEKLAKIKYCNANAILKPNQLKFANKILATMANLHANNLNYYQAMKELLLFPYQSIISQQNYIMIKKSAYQDAPIRDALMKILNVHKRCKNEGKEHCHHLLSFIKKMQQLSILHKNYEIGQSKEKRALTSEDKRII